MTDPARDALAERLGPVRQRAEAVLQGIIELRAMRGRLTKVTVADVALLLDLVDKALDPRRAPVQADRGHPAGTIPWSTHLARTYVEGCRCEDCRAANTEYIADWRERREHCRTCGGPAYEPMDYGSGRRQARRCSGCHKIVGRCSCAAVKP